MYPGWQISVILSSLGTYWVFEHIRAWLGQGLGALHYHDKGLTESTLLLLGESSRQFLLKFRFDKSPGRCLEFLTHILSCANVSVKTFLVSLYPRYF